MTDGLFLLSTRSRQVQWRDHADHRVHPRAASGYEDPPPPRAKGIDARRPPAAQTDIEAP
jgi:hypothetical protein